MASEVVRLDVNGRHLEDPDPVGQHFSSFTRWIRVTSALQPDFKPEACSGHDNRRISARSARTCAPMSEGLQAPMI
jgi:hypothetical protein